MNSRRYPSTSHRPQPTATSLLFQPSTTGWYSAWKARKVTAIPASAPEPEGSPAGDAEALARWLTGGSAPE